MIFIRIFALQKKNSNKIKRNNYDNATAILSAPSPPNNWAGKSFAVNRVI